VRPGSENIDVALKVFRLDAKKDLALVHAIRNGSARYTYLRERLGGIFRDRRCLMIGSAPGMDTPDRQPGDVAICVNGSVHNAGRIGVDDPDATFLVSHIFGRTTRQSRTTYDLLRGRRSRHVFVFTGTLDMDRCLEGVRAADLAYDAIDEISAHERAAIVGAVCGIELGFGKLDERVSTGITSAICAVWAGAKDVNLCGFSLSGGHSYTKYNARRLHVGPDMKFLSLCAELKLPVTTTSVELAAQFGIPLRRRHA
jgi:hypothetical protein